MKPNLSANPAIATLLMVPPFGLLSIQFLAGSPISAEFAFPIVALQFVVMTVMLWKRSAVLPVIFSAFLLYSAIPIYFQQVLFDVPMGSWRAGMASMATIRPAFDYYLLFMSFHLGFISIVYSIFGPTFKGYSENKSYLALRGGGLTYDIVIVLVSVATFFLTAVSSRDAWIAQAGVSDRFWVLALTVALAAIVSHVSVTNRRFMSSWRFWLPMIVALVGSASGFRFMLVAAVCGVVAGIAPRLKLTAPRVVAGAAVLGLSFTLLLLAAAGRSLGLSGIQTLSSFLSGDLSIVAANAYFGGAEQINLIGLYHFLNSPPRPLLGQSYIDGVIRALPNFVYTAYFEVIRPQDYILQNATFSSAWFRQNSLNLGAHFTLEAIVNFGKLGPFFVSAVATLAMAFFDKLKASRFGVGIYIGLCSFSYALAWYGFGNFVKCSAYFAAIYIVLDYLWKHSDRFVAPRKGLAANDLSEAA